MRVLAGSKIYELTASELYEKIGAKSPVCVDIGTGSGRYVLTNARTNSGGFYIGLDPVPDNMMQNSLRTQKLNKKNGTINSLFVVASIEKIPRELELLSDVVTVHLPWGSLRDGIVRCDPAVMGNLRRLGKSGARLVIIIGYDEQTEAAEREKRGLPPLSRQSILGLSGSYRRAGIRLNTVSVLDNKALQSVETDWAKRLAYGMPRQMYEVVCEYV